MKTRLFLLIVPLVAAAQVHPPSLGAVVDSRGRLHRIEGVPGALSQSPAYAEDVLSVAASPLGVYVKTASEVLGPDGSRWTAPDGTALLAFLKDGRPSAAWFEQSRELWLFHGDSLDSAPFPFEGEVQGLASPTAGRLVVLLEREGLTRRVEFSPEPFAVLADVEVEPGVLLPDGTMFTPEEGTWRSHLPGYLISTGPEGEVRLFHLESRTVHLVPPAADGPLVLSLLQGTAETPITSTIDFGQAPPGGSLQLVIRIRNTSAVAVTFSRLFASGQGFAVVNGPDLPLEIRAAGAYDIFVRFAPSAIGPYSGQLTVNGGIWELRGLSTSTPVLQRQVNGVWQDIVSGATIDLGPVAAQSSTSFAFSLANRGNALMQTGAISLSATGARLAGLPGGSVSIPAGGSVAFNLYVESSAAGSFSAVLAVGAAQYTIRAVITVPVLPRARLSVTSLQSGQQVKLGLKLDAASPVDADGNLTMSFQPAVGLGADPALLFLPAGSTSVTFRLTAGSDLSSFAGSSTVTLQTGSTAGTITFAIRAGTQSWIENITIAPQPITLTAIQTQLGDTQAGIDLNGLDNSRTASRLTFTFYLTDGSRLAAGPIEVDTADVFRKFYADHPPAAGTFLVQVRFPVAGTASLLGSVEVSFANAQGVSATLRANFPH